MLCLLPVVLVVVTNVFGPAVMESRSARQTKNWSSPLRLSIGCMSPTAFRWYCMRLLASRWYVPAVFRYYCMTCGRLLSSYWRACCIVAPVRRVACRQYAPTAFWHWFTTWCRLLAARWRDHGVVASEHLTSAHSILSRAKCE